MAEPRRTLLAEMALRFVDQPETLATASLGHILAVSSVARDAVRSWLAERGVTVPDGLVYRTEVVDAGQEGRPDVVGAIGDARHLILEGKFWAALTDAQPTGYLRSLQPGGCLLVVTPGLRFETVGAELARRCRLAGLGMSDAGALTRGGITQVGEGHWLGVVSWRGLLGFVRTALVDRGEVGLAGDVEQLLGLSELEDQETFLPVTSQDLATPTPRRVQQFMELVEALCRRGVQIGLLHRSGLRSVGVLGRYTRYVAAGPIQLGVSVDLDRWARQRQTPLWLEAAIEPGQALTSLEAEIPPRVFYDGFHGRPVIPLEIPLHVERDAVVDALLDQMRAVVERIRDCRPTATIRDPAA